MSTSSDRNDGLVPLAERIRWTAGLRVGFALAPVPLVHLQAATPLASTSTVTVVAVAYLLLGLASAGLGRTSRSYARLGLSLGLVLDGLYLGWAFFALGDLAGTGGALVVLHVVGICLLMSFRSGLRMAMWHSLVALFVLQARSDAAFLPLVPEPLQPFPSTGLAVHLGVVWAAAVTTATFAAVNERELRRRRYDAEALRRYGIELETCFDPARILELLATFAREELLAPRVLAIMGSNEPHAEAFDGTFRRPSGDLGEVVVLDGDRLDARRAPDLDEGSVVHLARERRATLRVQRLGSADGSWIEELLPDASNLVVVPLTVEEPYFGALLLSYGTPTRWRRTRRVERRLLATAEQAAAQCGLALGRAVMMAQLREAAETDGLTRIANRAMFDEALARECDRSLRSGHPVSVALLDLDRFKLLNDNHGHLEGDQALRDVAHTLRAVCRQGDLPARYGGEEFAVLLLDATAEQAAVAAERFRRAIEEMDRPVSVTASIGVASWPADGLVPRELVASADRALYAAKEAGRNRVVRHGVQDVAPA